MGARACFQWDLKLSLDEQGWRLENLRWFSPATETVRGQPRNNRTSDRSKPGRSVCLGYSTKCAVDHVLGTVTVCST